MKSKIFSFIILMLFSASISSCSQDDSEKRIEYAKIVESRSSQDLLNDLYVGSDADVEAIARIMNVTPSSIERLRKGETEPTDEFEERIHEVSTYYMIHDSSFTRLRSIADPEYGWYDTVLDFPSRYPWLFWSLNVFIVLIGALAFIIPTFFIDWILMGLELLLFFSAWIASLICSPDAILDNYIESINPTIEQII